MSSHVSILGLLEIILTMQSMPGAYKEHTNQSLHWTHQYAILSRTNNASLDNTQPQKYVKVIQPIDILPGKEVQQRLKRRWAILVSRVVCKYISPLKHVQDVVLFHLPHIYSKEMTGKSTIVSHILCILYYQFT